MQGNRNERHPHDDAVEDSATAPAALDGTDRAILAALMEDGRMTNAALAARVGVAESTCAYRVKALRESGVIASINARVDLAAIGRPIQAVIQVHLSSHSRVHINELLDRLVDASGRPVGGARRRRQRLPRARRGREPRAAARPDPRAHHEPPGRHEDRDAARVRGARGQGSARAARSARRRARAG